MKVRARTVLGLLVLFVVASSASLVLADGGAAHRVHQTRPIKLGTSGGNAMDGCFTGTLGCLVTKGGTNYILSNHHVLLKSENNFVPGDDITQPGVLDSDCQYIMEDAVADLAEYKAINFSGAANEVDAAIAAVRAGAVSSTGELLDLGQPSAMTTTPRNGMKVKKSGRTTGLTQGRVKYTNVSINVSYGPGLTALFVNQIGIGPGSFSAGGDSGSLIVESSSKKPVGLLFAGGGGLTFANRIDNVLGAFGVTVVGSGTAGAGAAGAGGGNGNGPSAQAIAAQEKHGASLLARGNVHGHGLGKENGREVVAVFVELDTPEVRASLPADLDGVPVEVVETGPIEAY